MFGRMMFRLLALVALVAVLAVGGGAVYQLGLTDGVAQGLVQGAGSQVVVPYGYAGHGGFGFFGFLATLIFLFLVFGLLRTILFGGRGGHRGMHRGWGRGWDHHEAHGGVGSDEWAKGPWADRARGHLESWHRDAHAEPPPAEGTDRPANGDQR